MHGEIFSSRIIEMYYIKKLGNTNNKYILE